MNVSCSWLRAVAPSLDSVSAEEIIQRLADRGAPVEDVVRPGAGLEDIRVARVREVREHPDADRLRLCDVETGSEVLQVVCGAPNVEAGRLYPFAPVGATLPGGMEIGKAKIRGQVSHGMLCSEKELGLGKDHDGIMTLADGLEVGSSFVESLGLDDIRLDVEITANRGDLLSHVGIARELVTGSRADVGPSEIPEEPELDAEYSSDLDEVSSAGATIRIDDPDLCTRYLGAVIRGVEIGPSPAWLRERLVSVGARPINNVVDATNFVLLELGQPLHAFDLDRLADSTVVVRRASDGETLRTLDGVDRKLESDMLCICDAVRPVALAGIMGGEESEVDAGTTDILLECALFEPKQVRSTRQRLLMSTDASYRFERGVDPQGMERALERAVQIILATSGGTLEGPIMDVHPRPWTPRTVPLRLERVEKLLGIPFTPERVTDLLTPLGFDVETGDGALRIQVPGWRTYDVFREVDLIEEIARTHGFDRFPDELTPYRPGTVPDHPLFLLEDGLRDLMAGRGFLEAQVPAFARESEGEVTLANPISAEETALRSSLLPGLLRSVERNLARGVRDVRLFELGTCFFHSREGGNGGGKGAGGAPAALPREETRLGLVATGRRRPGHWSGDDPAVDVWDLKGWLEELGARIHGSEASLEPLSAGGDPDGVPVRTDGFAIDHIDTATAFRIVAADGRVVGAGGRIRTASVDTPPWAGPVWGLEIELPNEPAVRTDPTYVEPSPYPGAYRDLALVLPDELTAASLAETMEEAGGPHLGRVEIFDLYRGPGVAEGSRSVAYRLHFSSRERTLTDEEVDEAADRVVRRIEEEFGVQPRS